MACGNSSTKRSCSSSEILFFPASGGLTPPVRKEQGCKPPARRSDTASKRIKIAAAPGGLSHVSLDFRNSPTVGQRRRCRVDAGSICAFHHIADNIDIGRRRASEEKTGARPSRRSAAAAAFFHCADGIARTAGSVYLSQRKRARFFRAGYHPGLSSCDRREARSGE